MTTRAKQNRPLAAFEQMEDRMMFSVGGVPAPVGGVIGDGIQREMAPQAVSVPLEVDSGAIAGDSDGVMVLSGTTAGSDGLSGHGYIPDGPHTDDGGWLGMGLAALPDLPAGATVTKVELNHVITHGNVGDLQVRLSNDSHEWTVRNNTGGTSNNIDETSTALSLFDGDLADQTWLYEVRDTAAGYSGELVSVTLRIYYDWDSTNTAPAGGGTVATDATATGESYMLAEHWGGTWSDAEKSPSDTDDNLCWAAVASNVLEWTGWGKVGGMDNTDEMFTYFQDHWTNLGGKAQIAWKWWFDGTNVFQGWDEAAQVDVPGGDFYASENFSDYSHNENYDSEVMGAIDEYLRDACGTTIAIRSGFGGHGLTVWGFNYDPNADPDADDYYNGIWLTNSDDNEYQEDAPDKLRYYEVAKSGDRWYLQNYRGVDSWFIDEVHALARRPADAAPDKDQLVNSISVKIGGSQAGSLTFTDADGTAVSVALGTGGTATLHLTGQGIGRSNLPGRVVLTGTGVQLDSIELANTTLADVLVITAAGGDGVTTVGRASSHTPLGVLSAPNVDFIGDGIEMTGDGYAPTVIVHDMANGADIVMEGQGATAGVVIVGDRLSDGTDVLLGSPLSVLRASEWLGGQLATPWATSIAVTGNPWTGVRGDFGADATFTGADAWGRALASLYVAGKITDSNIVAQAGSVGSVVAAQWDQGLLRARSISVLRTTGNWADPEIDGDFGADVETTDPNANSSLAAAVIIGQIDGNWDFAAPVGLIYAGSTANTWTLNADANVTNVLVIGDLAGDMSAEYYTSIYAGGALSADITATGMNAAGASIVSLSVGVANDISVDVQGGIYVVRLAKSVNTDTQVDTIHAEWITSLVSYGDVDFDLTLDGAAANGYALVAATILGEIGGGAWDLEGNVSSIYAAETGADWTLNANGWVSSLYARRAMGGEINAQYINAAMTAGDLTADFQLTGKNAYGTSLGVLSAGHVRGDVSLWADGVINLIRVWQWDTGRIQAGGINTMVVVGNAAAPVALDGDFGAEIVLSSAGVPASRNTLGYAYIAGNLQSNLWDITGDLGTLYVAGAVEGTDADPVTIRSTGSMAAIMAGRFEHANVLAGIASGVTDHAAAYGNFANPSATIGSLTVLGAGLDGQCLTDSQFSAGRFGVVNFFNADLADADVDLWCRNSAQDDEVRLLSYRDPTTSNPGAYSSHWGADSAPGFLHVVEREGRDDQRHEDKAPIGPATRLRF